MSGPSDKPTTRLAHVGTKKIVGLAQKEAVERRRLFRPLAIEIGWIVYEWNRLQEWLAQLFADVVSQELLGVGLAAWYSLTNERAQRDMLRAVVDTAAVYPQAKLHPRAQSDIKWVLKELDVLSGRRNDAIHAPLVFIMQSSVQGVELKLEPHHFFGNPRAKQLKGKDLLGEFQWYRAHLEQLANFTEKMHFTILFPDDLAWPDRPQLPPRGHFPSRARQHRKNK